MRQFAGVDLIEFAAQRVRAPPHARILVGRIGVGPAEGLDANQVFVQGVAEPGNLHLADVAEEVAHLRGPYERGAREHLLERRAFFTLENRVGDVHR